MRPTAATEMYLEDADIEAAKKEWEELELSEVEEWFNTRDRIALRLPVAPLQN